MKIGLIVLAVIVGILAAVVVHQHNEITSLRVSVGEANQKIEVIGKALARIPFGGHH